MSTPDRDPFEDLEAIADELEIIGAALGSPESCVDMLDEKSGRMLERLAARMNGALNKVQYSYEKGVDAIKTERKETCQ